VHGRVDLDDTGQLVCCKRVTWASCGGATPLLKKFQRRENEEWNIYLWTVIIVRLKYTVFGGTYFIILRTEQQTKHINNNKNNKINKQTKRKEKIWLTRPAFFFPRIFNDVMTPGQRGRFEKRYQILTRTTGSCLHWELAKLRPKLVCLWPT